jgi:hypothetical protein
VPFKALQDGDPVYPEQIETTDAELACFDCDESVAIRESHKRSGSFVARHFWHPNGTPDGCEAIGGESWKHQRMKSIAASKAKKRWPDATVQLEQQVAHRRADVLVVFSEFHHRYGNGIAIEAQHKHEDKEFEVVEADFQSNRYSVLWLHEEQYHGKDVNLDAGNWAIWWSSVVPDKAQWDGYHGIVYWLQQEQRPTVEREIPFPSEFYEVKLSQAWERGKEARNSWEAVYQRKLGRGSSFLSLSQAPKSNDSYVVLSKGRGSKNEIVHVPVQLSDENAGRFRTFADSVEGLADDHGDFVDEDADNWQTEVEVWLETYLKDKSGLLKIKRPPDGTIAFVLKDIERGNANGVTVASPNLHPERLIKAIRQIALVIEDS